MTSSQVTLFGATGYTGQLAAQALSRAGISFRIAGRSAERLARLSAALPDHPQWLTADAARSASLPPLFQDTRLLINCAGPFTDLGERVISQAALSGVHYLDITNELGYVFRARGFNDLAQKTGAALIPACGFEVALADCTAHLVGSALLMAKREDLRFPPEQPVHSEPQAQNKSAARPEPSAQEVPAAQKVPVAQEESADLMEPLDEINIVYMLNWTGASVGTRRSAVRSLATSWVTYRNGGWTGQIPGGKVRRFNLPGGKRFALSFPSCEGITVPNHLPVHQVNAWMTSSKGVRFWGPVFVPLLSRLSRSILRGLILAIAGLGGKPASASFPSGSAGDADQRKRSSFAIAIEARSGKMMRSALLTGRDPYGLTAEIIAYAAQRLVEPGYNRKGFLAPAQAFDPRALLDYAQKNWGMTFIETAT